MKVYTRKGDNILRKGEHVATIDENGEVKLTDPKFVRCMAPIVRFLNSEKDEEERQRKVSEPELSEVATEALANIEKLKEVDVDVVDNPDKEKAKMNEEAELAKKTGDKDILDDKLFARRNGIPAPPKRNPMYGNKTPSYVEWLKRYRPDKFERVFKVTGIGEVPVFDEDGNVKEYKKATMAKCKTHLTEKVEADETEDEDVSWSAM